MNKATHKQEKTKLKNQKKGVFLKKRPLFTLNSVSPPQEKDLENSIYQLND